MPIKQVNLTLYQGDDWAGSVTVLNTDMSPADITGYTAQSQIRTGVADQQPLVAAQLTATVVAPNQVLLALTNAQTTGLSGQYIWDLQITSPGGIITTILQGNVSVSQEVTRSLGMTVLSRVERAFR